MPGTAPLAVLASPRRCEILRLVWRGELAAGAIRAAMPDVTFGAVSLHLRALAEAGLVDVRVDGRNRFYCARRDAFGPVGRMLERMWDDALWRLKLQAELEHSKRGPRARPPTEEAVTRTATLVHSLERSLVIHARPEIVFRFFTDTSRWASWWGAGSTIDPRPEGRVLIRYPDGTEAAGSILEIAPPARLVFTYGYVTGSPIEPGSSMVTIRLEAHPSGTRLHLTHAFADPAVRDHHVQGWRYQLSLFANAIANDQHAGAGTLTDQWFAAWSEEQPATREAMLRAIATPDLSLRDRFSALDGIDDVLEHLAAARRFMPGLRMARDGHVRQCQGLALADWVVTTAAGDERGRGTNLFVFSAEGRIESVTGFWRAGPA